MSRKRALNVLSWIMAEDRRGRSRRRSDVISTPTRNEPNSSDDDEGEGNQMNYFNFKGRTFYDFESDNSLPNLTVKTFLRDCITHPKILFHKDFQFFRRYLSDIGMDLTLPPDSPFSEDHQDDTFCVDKGDKKWLSKLKNRVQNEDIDNYWAQIIPVTRKSDLGLVIFRWQSSLISIHFLHVYLKFCESMSQPNSSEYVDGYIEDFKKAFDIQRNIDTEARFTDDIEATEMRRAKLGITEEKPAITHEASVLLTLPKQNHPRTPHSRNTRAAAAASSSSSDSRRATPSTSTKKTYSESDTTAVASGDDPNCSEYLGPHGEKRRRAMRKKASESSDGKSTRLDAAKARHSFSNDSNNNKADHEPSPSSSNGIRRVTRGSNGLLHPPNGKFPENGKSNKTILPVCKTEPTEELVCKLCKDSEISEIFLSKELLHDHYNRSHAPSFENMISCSCGIKVVNGFMDIHKRSCRTAAASSSNSRVTRRK